MMNEEELEVLDRTRMHAAALNPPKTSEDVKRLYDEHSHLLSIGETRLGFHTFAGITWNEYTGWQSTGLWPVPPKVEICFVCEKELEKTSYDSIAQSYGGGEIRMSFCFGSRFDWLGVRSPIRGGPIHEIDMGEDFGVVSFQNPIGSEPIPEVLKNKNRATRLSACNRIIGSICDDCFEKKAHLLQGYESVEGEKKLQLLVE